MLTYSGSCDRSYAVLTATEGPFHGVLQIVKLEKNGFGYHYILANLVSRSLCGISVPDLSMGVGGEGVILTRYLTFLASPHLLPQKIPSVLEALS